jgi:putative glycosyltransferase
MRDLPREEVELSVVTTMYRSAPYLEEFHRRVSETASRIASSFEIIFVNDDSPDDALEVAVSLHRRDPRVRIIDLSRNFGHHKAMMTGLMHARGRLVFLADCDLEVAPELMIGFREALTNTQADVIYGVQEGREGRFLDRLAAEAFYTIFNQLSSHRIPRNLVTERLMTRRYVRALVRHQEREMTISGLWVITGFKQVEMVVKKAYKGHSSYTLAHRVNAVINNLTSWSNRPLVLIFYLGLLMSGLSAVGILYLLIRWAFFGGFLVGWGSVVLSIWLLGGLMMLSLGTIGFYLSKVFIETKQRPYTIVRAMYEAAVGETVANDAGIHR